MNLRIKQNILVITSTLVILITWLSLILVELRMFDNRIILLLVGVSVSALLFLYRRINLGLVLRSIFINKIDLFVITFIIIFSIFNSLLAHETFFGGRDDGVYSNSAVYLSKNHSLVINHDLKDTNFVGYLNLYGNYFQPGFHYAYIAWLAMYYSFFGIAGLMWSNFIPTVLGLISIYFLAKELKDEKSGMLTIILFTTTYPMLWFTRRTLTEIFSLFLVWFAIYCLVKLFKSRNSLYACPALLSLGLFMHTRFEAIYAFAIALLFLLFWHFKKIVRISIINILVLVFVLINFSLYSIYVQPNYNKDFLSPLNQLLISPFNKYILRNKEPEKPMTERLSGLSGLDPGTYTLDELIGLNVRPYLMRVLAKYNLLFFIIFLPLSIYFVLKKFRSNLIYLIPILINIPILTLLNNPYNSTDLPWLIRRYIPQILPFSILFFSFVLSSINQKKLLVFSTSLLLLLNLQLSSEILIFRDNYGITKQTSKIASLFGNNDKILVDGLIIPTFQWPILADPLFFIYGKNSKLIREGWAASGEIPNGGIDSEFDFSINNYLVTNVNNSWFIDYLKDYNLEVISITKIDYNFLGSKKINHLDNYKTVDIGPYNTGLNSVDVIVYKILPKNKVY